VGVFLWARYPCRGGAVSYERVTHVQGYLAHKKLHPPTCRTLQQAYAWGLRAILGGGGRCLMSEAPPYLRARTRTVASGTLLLLRAPHRVPYVHSIY